jgi:hypothetical protein
MRPEKIRQLRRKPFFCIQTAKHFDQRRRQQRSNSGEQKTAELARDRSARSALNVAQRVFAGRNGIVQHAGRYLAPFVFLEQRERIRT